MVGWFTRRRPGRRFGAVRLGAGKRRQPALPRHRGGASHHPAERAGAARSVGQARQPGSVYADITWIGFTGTADSRSHDARRLPRSAARATRRSTPCRTRPRAGREVRGFEADQAARAGLHRRRATRTPSCTAPATASARTCTATARTWTTTKPTTSAGCCPAAGLPSNLGCISRILAFEPRSTWSGRPSGPEVTGPRQKDYPVVVLVVVTRLEECQCRVARRRCSIRC